MTAPLGEWPAVQAVLVERVDLGLVQVHLAGPGAPAEPLATEQRERQAEPPPPGGRAVPEECLGRQAPPAVTVQTVPTALNFSRVRLLAEALLAPSTRGVTRRGVLLWAPIRFLATQDKEEEEVVVAAPMFAILAYRAPETVGAVAQVVAEPAKRAMVVLAAADRLEFFSSVPPLLSQYLGIPLSLTPADMAGWEELAASEDWEAREELEEVPGARTSVSVGMVAAGGKEPMGFRVQVEAAGPLLALSMPLGLSLQCCRTFSQSGLAELVARAQRALNPPDKLG